MSNINCKYEKQYENETNKPSRNWNDPNVPYTEEYICWLEDKLNNYNKE